MSKELLKIFSNGGRAGRGDGGVELRVGYGRICGWTSSTLGIIEEDGSNVVAPSRHITTNILFMSNPNKKHYIILAILYILLILSAYDNIRSGYIADEQNLGGCEVSFLGCWAVPTTLLLFIVTLVYTLIILTKKR